MVKREKWIGDIIISVIVATIITGAWFILNWNIGFDLADEGYYWYGSKRVLSGDVPMRDFTSYDIGRYYWAAAWMNLLGGSGIRNARVAAWIFQWGAVWGCVALCLWAIPDKMVVGFRVLMSVIFASALSLWMFPYYKVFDHGASIAVIGMVVLLLSAKGSRHWFFAGCILGLVSMIGRNHGLYGLVAAFGAMIFLRLSNGNNIPRGSHMLQFIFGFILAYSPTFLMMLAIPEFYEAFTESIIGLIKSGTTNIGLPIPWPWNFEHREIGWILWLSKFFPGLGFIMILLVPVLTLVFFAANRNFKLSTAHILLLAGALAGIPYAHYAYSRADVTHLALGIFPLLISVQAVGMTLRKPVICCLGLFLVSLIAVSNDQLIFRKNILGAEVVEVEIDGLEITTAPHIAQRLAAATAALQRHPVAAQKFLAMPDMPGLHAIRNVNMPIWEIYSTIPRNSVFEQQELIRLNSSPPEIIIISNHALDQREEFRFSRMHPDIYSWVRSNYVLEDAAAFESGHLYRRKSNIEVYLPKSRPGLMGVVNN